VLLIFLSSGLKAAHYLIVFILAETKADNLAGVAGKA
jgi:hypothetical protein